MQRGVDSLPQHVDRQVMESQNAQEKKATEQNARVLQLCERLDERLGSEVGAAEARLGEAMHQLERKLTDDAERAGSEALDTVSRLASAVDQVAADIIKVGADLDSKFTGVCSKLDEKYDGVMASVRGQVETGLRSLESSGQKQGEECEQMIRAVSAKFSDDVSSVLTRLQDADRQIVDVREQLSSASSALDTKITESAASAGDAAAALERSVSDIARSLVQKIEDAASLQASKAAEDRRAAEAGREELLRHIDGERARADGMIAELGSRLGTSADAVQAQVRQVRRYAVCRFPRIG